MRLQLAGCACLASLSRSALAFYPFVPGSDPSDPDVSRSVRRLADAESRHGNKNVLHLPIERVRRAAAAAVGKRDNEFPIVESDPPSFDDSVAIHQDSTDFSYFTRARFGTSDEDFLLLLDTGASNTWVMGGGCDDAACGLHNTLGRDESSSLELDSTPFNITYGTGKVSGANLGTDTLHLGPFDIPLTFGLADSASSEFAYYPMDGIMGFGRGDTTDPSIAGPTMMDALVSAGLIDDAILGVHLSRFADGAADGELSLGAANPARFAGALNWLPAKDNPEGFWEVDVDGLRVGGDAVELEGLAPRSAIVDTGTSFVLMPPADARALHARIPGAARLDGGEAFVVPCGADARVAIAFGGRAYGLRAEDYVGAAADEDAGEGMCRSNIIGRQTFGDDQWLVGDVFLKNVYAVFDFEERRVGFGVPSGGEEEEDEEGDGSTSGEHAEQGGADSGSDDDDDDEDEDEDEDDADADGDEDGEDSSASSNSMNASEDHSSSATSDAATASATGNAAPSRALFADGLPLGIVGALAPLVAVL
ncbi:aspartic peptidase domain-containing protein [Lineolata rhizophorae]|uniref:Aspartic peptidase domain-containing protein n=1 Tax=Lineolata rhizophorae TaxID=578093 RepID=A0A6A6PCB8_9PEZI|nr:aspartic peptidase domain-containing protein [Lineolata rhizophorae]